MESTLQIASMRQEHAALVTEQQKCEAAYRRFAIEECDMVEDHIVAKIEQARSGPQKSKLLQAIYQSHAAVVSKEAEIKAVERSALEGSVDTGETTPMAQQLREKVCVSLKNIKHYRGHL